jgi:hypothetical protein
MDKKNKKILKILKSLDKIWYEVEINEEPNENNGPGRKQVYSDLAIFKIFIVMNILNIKTIKGIWRFLSENKAFRKACGLSNTIDRTTLNRRLSEKIKNWFS